MIPDRPAKHGVAEFECVEDGPLGDGAFDFEVDMMANSGQLSQVSKEFDADEEFCDASMRLGSTGELLRWSISHPAKCGPATTQFLRVPSAVG